MEKTDTSLPLDFPPLLALAEANVRANWPIEEQTRARLGHHVFGDTFDDYNVEVRDLRIGLEADRLRDLTRRDSQAPWLEWLASHIAPTVIPPVGCPGWRRLRVPGGVLYALGSVYGLELVVSFGPTKQIAQLECPALDNPDAPDAPIRALRVAVLKVGSRGGA